MIRFCGWRALSEGHAVAQENGDKPEIHPVIAALEADGEGAIEFGGFLGAGDDETLRLYADLGMSSYLDIPRNSVVHIGSDPSGEPGKVRAFVRRDQKVREVNQRFVAAFASAFSTSAFPDPKFPEVEHGGLRGCYGRCESAFAQQADRVREQRNQASLICSQKGLDSPACQNALGLAARTEAQAVGFLTDCLEQCRANQPYQLRIWPPIALDVDYFVRKYLS